VYASGLFLPYKILLIAQSKSMQEKTHLFFDARVEEHFQSAQPVTGGKAVLYRMSKAWETHLQDHDPAYFFKFYRLPDQI